MNIREFTLKRISSAQHGTFGVLLDGETQFALTVEPPWKNNAPFISCIPFGRYVCERVQSRYWGNTFTVRGVLNRTYIRFHWGNYGGLHGGLLQQGPDTKGCIVVGEEFGTLDSVPALLSSKRGFREFLERTAGIDKFYLNIKECF